MFSKLQGELFGLEDYYYICRNCRGEFPRSIEFFPKGRCKDRLASFCRKCSNSFGKNFFTPKKENERLSTTLPRKKTCDDCGDSKQLREFYMSSFSFDGKTQTCKVCVDEKYFKLHQIRQKYFDGFAWVIYFIQDSRNKRVKIGLSEDPYRTLSELQDGSSEKLQLLAFHDSGEKDNAETSVKTLFTFFKSCHKGNGWFEMMPSLEQYIRLIKSGDNLGVRILLNPQEMNKNEAL